jgi:hypothetical protein
MEKLISLAFLAGGIVLAIIGMNAANSFSSEFARFFTGSPTDNAVWMLLGGMVAAAAGLATLLRRPKPA